jgi:hypothetical protein
MTKPYNGGISGPEWVAYPVQMNGDPSSGDAH